MSSLHYSPSRAPLRVLAAPNAYKESLTALEACRSMRAGVLAACPDAEVKMTPLADGGDGTIQALVDATGGEQVTVEVRDPLGRTVRAPIGRLGDGQTYVVEMAQASGLALLEPAERDPRKTSTLGTGDCLLAALAMGARRILIGIGGSATNDGGAGMARSLGYRLLDGDEKELDGTGGCLAQVARIDAMNADPRLDEAEVIVMCDVENPLTGTSGASAVFGPQKGATPEIVAELDAGLQNWAAVIQRDLGFDILELPGSGAAGGLGGGLVAFARGRLGRGFDTIAETVGLDRAMKDVDLILTGEGRLDGSTLHGKAPVGVARRGQAAGVPVVAIAGILASGWEGLLAQGVAAAFSMTGGPVDLETAMREADTLLQSTTEQAVRLFVAGRSEVR